MHALEAACAEFERALAARDWPEMDRALAQERRSRHGLQNAFEAAASVRDEAFDRELFKRVRYVYAVRENQLARLRQYRDQVGERLTLLSKWKQFARNFGKETPRGRLGPLDQLR